MCSGSVMVVSNGYILASACVRDGGMDTYIVEANHAYAVAF
jgi:hypothetical protein